jgi:hypothetical protein
MKKIYCIEEWCKFEDGPREIVRDGILWCNYEIPCKIGCDDILHEFDNEKEFTEKILSIIEKGGIIGKVYIKEMPDDYSPMLHL